MKLVAGSVLVLAGVMASWTEYKGLTVPDGATGDAGGFLIKNFKLLADRAPIHAIGDPTKKDDANRGYLVGSQWLNSSTLTMWICTDATAEAAVWKTQSHGTADYVAKTAEYSIEAADFVVDCTSGTFNVTLPTAEGVAGKIYWIKNSGDGVITVRGASSQTIDGAASYVLGKRYDRLQAMSNGANWIVLTGPK